MPLDLVMRDKTRHCLEYLMSFATRYEPGRLLDYTTIRQDLRLPPGPELSHMIRLANRELKSAKRLFINTRTQGYRIALAREHLEHYDHRMKRTRRQLTLGKDSLEAADMAQLSPQDQERCLNKLRLVELCLLQSRKRNAEIVTLAKRNDAEQKDAIEAIRQVLRRYQRGGDAT